VHKGLHDRLQEFIEQEQKSKVNPERLERLWEYTAMETMYWQLPPEERNTLNKFFGGMVDDIIENMTVGNYGARIVLESAIVTAFEAGVRYGQEPVQEDSSDDPAAKFYKE